MIGLPRNPHAACESAAPSSCGGNQHASLRTKSSTACCTRIVAKRPVFGWINTHGGTVRRGMGSTVGRDRPGGPRVDPCGPSRPRGPRRSASTGCRCAGAPSRSSTPRGRSARVGDLPMVHSTTGVGENCTMKEHYEREQFESTIRELVKPLNNQYPRPWMTKLDDPRQADVFIVGKNQSKGYRTDAVSHERHVAALFNRPPEGCRRLYDELTSEPSPTRKNIDALVGRLEDVGVENVLENECDLLLHADEQLPPAQVARWRRQAWRGNLRVPAVCNRPPGADSSWGWCGRKAEVDSTVRPTGSAELSRCWPFVSSPW